MKSIVLVLFLGMTFSSFAWDQMSFIKTFEMTGKEIYENAPGNLKCNLTNVVMCVPKDKNEAAYMFNLYDNDPTKKPKRISISLKQSNVFYTDDVFYELGFDSLPKGKLTKGTKKASGSGEELNTFNWSPGYEGLKNFQLWVHKNNKVSSAWLLR